MTYYPFTSAAESVVEPSLHMAVIDEYGQEVPITELDIRRSLRLLESEDAHPNQHNEAFDSLMERVYAARAIA